jgi:phosphopantothenoylcysteine decarboxylase/phosphopantothenate--cysteine ligase
MYPFKSSLENKKVLITAGPTREAIDPVRYISNHSSGKMGYALAESFLLQGATVFLISGPVHLPIRPHHNLEVVHVNSASEMYLACCRYFEQVDIAVFAAAVADYRPEKIAEQKIKKSESSFTIKMVKNIDIGYEFGLIKTENQLSIGFALETNDEVKHAINKLQRKNFDMIILNSMNDFRAGFGYDTNKVSIIKKDVSRIDFALKTKKDVANDIVLEISELASKNQESLDENGVFEYENMYR